MKKLNIFFMITIITLILNGCATNNLKPISNNNTTKTISCHEKTKDFFVIELIFKNKIDTIAFYGIPINPGSKMLKYYQDNISISKNGMISQRYYIRLKPNFKNFSCKSLEGYFEKKGYLIIK